MNDNGFYYDEKYKCLMGSGDGYNAYYTFIISEDNICTYTAEYISDVPKETITYTSDGAYMNGELVCKVVSNTQLQMDMGEGTFADLYLNDFPSYKYYGDIDLASLEPGLYTERNNLVMSWDDLVNTYGLNIGMDYDESCNQETVGTMYNVLYNNSELNSGAKLVIDDSVTRLGNYSLYNTQQLTYIYIPDSVTSIGSYAFMFSNVKNIEIPSGVTVIEDSAFQQCNVMSISIPDSVTSIGDSAFEDCNKLKSVTIPNSVTSIGDYAFWLCDSLENVVLSNTLTTIGKFAFKDCISLKSITIPGSLTTIGDYAFEDCTSLSSVTIQDGVKSIGFYMFNGCTNLASVDIPNSVTNIDNAAFASCTNLKNISLPNGLTEIKSNTFSGSGLTSIVIPDTVKSIEGTAFSSTNLVNVEIPSGVESIGYYVFGNCKSLKSAYIPSTVTSFDFNLSDIAPFMDCSSDLKIYCESSEKPSGWDSSWNKYSESGTLDVIFGVTVEAYRELISE